MNNRIKASTLCMALLMLSTITFAQKSTTIATFNNPVIDALYDGAECGSKSSTLDVILDFDVDFDNISPANVREITFTVSFSAQSSAYTKVNWLANTNDWLGSKNFTVTALSASTYQVKVNTPNGVYPKKNLNGATVVIVHGFETDTGGNFGSGGTCGINSSSFSASFSSSQTIKAISPSGGLATYSMSNGLAANSCEPKTCSSSPTYKLTKETAITGLTISPNPVAEQLTINNTEMIEALEVYTLNGQLVKEKHGLSNTDYALSTANLSNGLYLLRVYSEGGVQVEKIQVIH